MLQDKVYRAEGISHTNYFFNHHHHHHHLHFPFSNSIHVIFFLCSLFSSQLEAENENKRKNCEEKKVSSSLMFSSTSTMTKNANSDGRKGRKNVITILHTFFFYVLAVKKKEIILLKSEKKWARHCSAWKWWRKKFLSFKIMGDFNAFIFWIILELPFCLISSL